MWHFPFFYLICHNLRPPPSHHSWSTADHNGSMMSNVIPVCGASTPAPKWTLSRVFFLFRPGFLTNVWPEKKTHVLKQEFDSLNLSNKIRDILFYYPTILFWGGGAYALKSHSGFNFVFPIRAQKLYIISVLQNVTRFKSYIRRCAKSNSYFHLI